MISRRSIMIAAVRRQAKGEREGTDGRKGGESGEKAETREQKGRAVIIIKRPIIIIEARLTL